ncbi:phosphopentomutase [Bacillaceae bacterium SIJ1]|uniref:phosphopentomutase n=1 Tax=Litoribacterium kuwaitense TaxID=1398745 RepID=UPI0013EBDCBC|nr:phosphopentomutase [Litoribacterium kuwaitense]NGP43645.1 phosphopentomutase [Litoribacterium kuwaitense]
MNRPFQRMVMIVLDSVGIGAAHDAQSFGDQGAHTLGHIASSQGGLYLPHLASMGLGHLAPIDGVPRVEYPTAHYTVMKPAANGKDTMTGHWEFMGVQVSSPFQTYPEGFPTELIRRIEAYSGRRVIGNTPASGTEIIQRYGHEQLQSGALIVYTSADSVLQIAAHEEVIPIDELYDICREIRTWTTEPPYLVGRIIARPYIGEEGHFVRTSRRRDFALKPFGVTSMNLLQDAGLHVTAIGKITDIYDGEGITTSVKTSSNDDGVDQTIRVLQSSSERGFIFCNLVDFDALYGHRRDPKGYKEALEAFDRRLPEIVQCLSEHDCLLITADHGNDPTFRGTDHTRENVPLLVYSPRINTGRHIRERETFSDIGATICDNFKVSFSHPGTSFLSGLEREPFEQ